MLVTHDLEEALSLSDEVYCCRRPCTSHSITPADPAAARSRAFPHASRLRTALREALGGPLLEVDQRAEAA
jgi:ABC-type nitrate/sulfonate/bicarbonate transport system ATPase subunit